MNKQVNYPGLKKISLVILSVFFIAAGINHFWHPQGYLDLIPPYLPKKKLINILSGCLEIIAGIGLNFPIASRFSALMIIVLLIFFIPAHVYLIQLKGCVSKNLCVPEWVAWIRLIPFQFILIWWVWKTYKWNP